jgi:16S rRNA (cytosine967-C5)-methyltransferase
VSATVAEIHGRGRTVVNAVLGKLADQLDSGPPKWPDLATELSYPDWIVERLEADLGSEAAHRALRAMNCAAPVSVRPDGYAQNLASRWIAEHVGARPGELVADLCAAPGGKPSAIAHSGPQLVAAADVDLGRCRMMLSNLERLGETRVAVLAADARSAPYRPGSFDRVLVDAPCSGLGTLARRPDLRWSSRPKDVDRLARIQREIIGASIEVVRRGGVLAYSVCTLTRAETTAIDQWLAASATRLVGLPPPGPPWEPVGRGALLLPQAAGTDGVYLLLLRCT